MRVAVGTEDQADFRQAEIDRHLEALALFIERVKRETGPSFYCTMLLRSPASAPAQALIAMKDELSGAGVRVKTIIAKLDPQDDLRQLFAALSALAPEAEASELIRWARNPRLLDAHEQVTYGDSMCWSGDAMRRDAEKRNPLVLFDMDASEAALFAQRAFKALWDGSATVPAHHLSGRGSAKPAGSYEQAQETPVTALRPHIQGWPLLRH